MAGSLEGVLAQIPGYGGFLAKRQFNQQEQMGQLQQAGALSQLLTQMQARQQDEQMRGDMQTSGGDPAKALEIALKSGNINAARQLEPLVKLAQEKAMREQTVQGMREITGGTPTAVGPQELGVGQPVAVAGAQPAAATPETSQARIEKLNKMSLLYANNPVVAQRIQAEVDRIQRDADKTPTKREIISGETLIQQERQPNGSWNEIGRGPRFARQISPAININAPSKESLSAEAIRDLAVQSLYDSNVLAGYRRDTTAMSRIGNTRVKLMKEANITSEDVVGGRAGFKADTASLNKITPQYDAITAFEKTAIRNGKILIELADKVDTTGVPVAERWLRAGRKAVAGDTDVARFDAQMNLYRAEAARILTQPNLSGVLTDTARKEMEDVIRNSASAAQIRGVVNLLERDFNNRKETLEEQIGNIRTRMRGRVGPGAAEAGTQPPVTTPAVAPANPAASASGTFTDAAKERRYQEYKKRNG